MDDFEILDDDGLQVLRVVQEDAGARLWAEGSSEEAVALTRDQIVELRDWLTRALEEANG